MKEAVGVAREEWQEGVELENRKKMELALKEQEAIWGKRWMCILCALVGANFQIIKLSYI